MSINESRRYVPRPDPALARRRIVAGALLGLLLQMLVATVMGVMAMPGTTFSDGLTMSAISSMVATPACFAVAFSLMFSPRTRQFGVGLLIGAILGTLLLAGGCAAFG